MAKKKAACAGEATRSLRYCDECVRLKAFGRARGVCIQKNLCIAISKIRFVPKIPICALTSLRAVCSPFIRHAWVEARDNLRIAQMFGLTSHICFYICHLFEGRK
ncbi:MAG: hypothetical protein ABI835_20645, partial [Chloroflexota bacterium]